MREALTVEEARAFYDHFGRKQDSQSFYEDAALDDLIAHSAFDSARHVFEFGCGTGRIAEGLFDKHLPPAATYEGVDVSGTMIDIASGRLRRFGERARLWRIDGTDPFSGQSGRPDRVLTSYVLDLLPEAQIAGFVDGCARVLDRGGRLCMVGLTFGRTPLSRVVTAGWRTLFRMSPRIVGGCRPIHLLPFLSKPGWEVVHHRVVSSYGVASEIVVAVKSGD